MKLYFLAACLVLLVPVGHVAADDDNWGARDYEYASSTLDNFFDRTHWDMVDPHAKRDRAKAARPISTVVAPRKRARMPEALAAQQPAAARAQYATFYRRMLTDYAAFERQAGLSKNDIAAAFSVLVVGAYMVYREVDVDPQAYKHVVDQMRAHLISMPDFMSLPLAQKQDMFEQAVILGMSMKAARESRTGVRTQGEAVLKWLFGSPDRVAITKRGLEVRARAARSDSR